MKYRIVQSEHLSMFEQLVQEMLERGWKLYGTPFVVIEGREDNYNRNLFCQAVIDDEDLIPAA